MIRNIILRMISVLLCFALLFGSTPAYAVDSSQPDAVGDTVEVSFFFAFFRSEPNFSFANIKAIFWNDREVKILGYSGSYVYVQDLKTHSEGYIHNMLLNDKRLNITKEYANIYSGVLKDDYVRVKFDLSGDLEWSLSEKGVVEVTKYNSRSFSVKGLKPGVVKLTVKCGDYKDTCDIACIDKWEDTETATAESPIKIMGTPGKYYKPELTIPQGATITARGYIPESSDYVYVSSGNIWGFIKLSDFPAIKYMMTQYHYYDQGYNLRFSSASSKISDYASVLNDVMMANFKLKVCPYIELYTSVADKCKIMIDGKVSSSNLATACPQTSGHYSNTCLTSDNVRNDLRKQFGGGGGNVSKVVWIGHMMTNNERSNAIVEIGDVVMTPYGVTEGSSSEIRKDRIYTLVHETSHQFGVHDHYCRGDISEITKKCSYSHCSKCYGGTIPKGCIMYERVNIEEVSFTELYCEDCIKDITNAIKNF